MKQFGWRSFCASIFLSSTFLAAAGSAAAVGNCVPSATNLCLLNNQIGFTVDWAGGSGMGSAEVVGPSFSDTGFFLYDDAEAAEVMVKVLDACSINGRYWVFIAQVSSQAQDVTVTNFDTGAIKTYSSLLGEQPDPVVDIDAFACDEQPRQALPTAELGGSDLLLAGGRFQASVDWTDFDNNTGIGTGLPITDRSGAFWFFNPSNLEVLVKVVPDSDTGFFGVAFSGTTNVAYNLTIRDTCSGQVRVFANPLGVTGAATDPMAFPITCAQEIFADGFESGNLEGWSAALP